MIYNYMDPKKFIEDEKSRNSEISKHKAYSMYYKTFIYYLNNNIVLLLRSMGQFIKLIFSVFLIKISAFRIAIIYFYINHLFIRIYCSDNDEEPLRKKIKIDESSQQIINITEFNREDIEFIYNYFYTKFCVSNNKTDAEKLCFYMGQLYEYFYSSDIFHENNDTIENITEIISSILQLNFEDQPICLFYNISKDINIEDLEENKFDNLKFIFELITIFYKKIQDENNEYIFLSEEFLKKNIEFNIDSLISTLINEKFYFKQTRTIKGFISRLKFFVKLISTNISEKKKNSIINGQLFEKIKINAHNQSISLKKLESKFLTAINYSDYNTNNLTCLLDTEIPNEFAKMSIDNIYATVLKYLQLLHQKIKFKFDYTKFQDNFKSYKVLYNSFADFIYFCKLLLSKIKEKNNFFFESSYLHDSFHDNFLKKITNIQKQYPMSKFERIDTEINFIIKFFKHWDEQNIYDLIVDHEYKELMDEKYFNVKSKVWKYSDFITKTFLYSIKEYNKILINQKYEEYMKLINSQIYFLQENNINAIKFNIKKSICAKRQEIHTILIIFFCNEDNEKLKYYARLINYKITQVYLYYFILVRIFDLIKIISIDRLKKIWINYFNRFVRDKVSNQEEKKVFETFFVRLHLLMRHFDVIVQKYALCKKDNHTA